MRVNNCTAPLSLTQSRAGANSLLISLGKLEQRRFFHKKPQLECLVHILSINPAQ